MIKAKIKDEEFDIPEKWEEVTTKVYFDVVDLVGEMVKELKRAEELRELKKDEEALEIEMEYLPMRISQRILCILTGKSELWFDDVIESSLDELSGKLGYLIKFNEADRIPFNQDTTIVDGDVIYGFKSLNGRTIKESSTMEYFSHKYKDSIRNRIPSQISVLVRHFEIVKDELTKEEVKKWDVFNPDRCEYFKELLMKQPCGFMLGINDFFLNTPSNLKKHIRKYSQNEKKKIKTKEDYSNKKKSLMS